MNIINENQNGCVKSVVGENNFSLNVDVITSAVDV